MLGYILQLVKKFFFIFLLYFKHTPTCWWSQFTSAEHERAGNSTQVWSLIPHTLCFKGQCSTSFRRNTVMSHEDPTTGQDIVTVCMWASVGSCEEEEAWYHCMWPPATFTWPSAPPPHHVMLCLSVWACDFSDCKLIHSSHFIKKGESWWWIVKVFCFFRCLHKTQVKPLFLRATSYS